MNWIHKLGSVPRGAPAALVLPKTTMADLNNDSFASEAGGKDPYAKLVPAPIQGGFFKDFFPSRTAANSQVHNDLGIATFL